MRRDIAKLIVQAANIGSEERQVLAAEKLPTGVWYAIVDDGQLWHEALYPAHGAIVRWARTPINILDGANGATALRQRTFKEYGEGEVRGLDLTFDRHQRQVTDLQSQYRHAARRMISGSTASSTAELIAQCKSLGIGGRANFDGVSVGKKMGKATYVHRDYQSVFPGAGPAGHRVPREDPCCLPLQRSGREGAATEEGAGRRAEAEAGQEGHREAGEAYEPQGAEADRRPDGDVGVLMERAVAKLVVEAALVVTAGKHWTDLPSKVSKEIRDELKSYIDYARDSAIETWHDQKREGFRDLFDAYEYEAQFWEDVNWEFSDLVNDLDPGTIPPKLDKVLRGGGPQLKKKNGIEKRIKRAPKKYQTTLLDLLAKAKEVVLKKWKEKVSKDPELHPSFEAWWAGSVQDVMDSYEASDEAREWAHKLHWSI